MFPLDDLSPLSLFLSSSLSLFLAVGFASFVAFVIVNCNIQIVSFDHVKSSKIPEAAFSDFSLVAVFQLKEFLALIVRLL